MSGNMCLIINSSCHNTGRMENFIVAGLPQKLPDRNLIGRIRLKIIIAPASQGESANKRVILSVCLCLRGGCKTSEITFK